MRPYSYKEWHPYQSYHEKRYLDVCLWTGFLARRFIRSNLTLFEIPNKLLVLHAFIIKKPDMNEIQKKFFCFLFSFPVVLQHCSNVFVSNIPYFFSIAQYLENVCIPRSLLLVKNSDTRQT